MHNPQFDCYFCLFICTFSIVNMAHLAQTSEVLPNAELEKPWYLETTAVNNRPTSGMSTLESVYHKIMTHLTKQNRPLVDSCHQECVTTLDCLSTSMSCFQASKQKKGCCLKVLKPNETGCMLDEQCRRACETSFCDQGQSPSRCMCDQDRHFLFNKCWNRCPDFAHSDPVIDNNGFSRCVLRIDSESVFKYIRRFKRQLRASYC